MEALYNRAKLPEHGAQSPDIPMTSVATIQHLTEKHPGQLKIDIVLYITKVGCQFLSQYQLHVHSVVQPCRYMQLFLFQNTTERRAFSLQI